MGPRILNPLITFAFLLIGHQLDSLQSLKDIEDVERGEVGAKGENKTVIYTNDDDSVFKVCRRIM